MNTRLSVNISDETAAVLRAAAERRGSSVTEIIRRAVGAYHFIETEVVYGEKTLKLVDREGRETVVTVL